MLKVTVAMLAVALAESASAAGWRSLRVDASSEVAYSESIAVLQDKLSPSRRHAFARALQDIWTEGVRQASGVQREYTPADYFARVDRMTYEQVVELLDPTGDRAKGYRAEYYAARGGGRSGFSPAMSSYNSYRLSEPGPNWRGGPQTQQ
jgi:hypothetical protein